MWRGIIKKGCGNRVFDFSTFIDIAHKLDSVGIESGDIEQNEEHLWARPIKKGEVAKAENSSGFQRQQPALSEGVYDSIEEQEEEEHLPRQSPPMWLNSIELKGPTWTLLGDGSTKTEAASQSQKPKMTGRRRPLSERSRSFSRSARLDQLLLQTNDQDRNGLSKNVAKEASTIEMSLDSLEEFKLRSLSRIAAHDLVSLKVED